MIWFEPATAHGDANLISVVVAMVLKSYTWAVYAEVGSCSPDTMTLEEANCKAIDVSVDSSPRISADVAVYSVYEGAFVDWTYPAGNFTTDMSSVYTDWSDVDVVWVCTVSLEWHSAVMTYCLVNADDLEIVVETAVASYNVVVAVDAASLSYFWGWVASEVSGTVDYLCAYAADLSGHSDPTLSACGVMVATIDLGGA